MIYTIMFISVTQRLLLWIAILILNSKGYSANSHIKVLDDNLYSIRESGLEFMQDNATIHSVKTVKAWFEKNGIALIDQSFGLLIHLISTRSRMLGLSLRKAS